MYYVEIHSEHVLDLLVVSFLLPALPKHFRFDLQNYMIIVLYYTVAWTKNNPPPLALQRLDFAYPDLVVATVCIFNFDFHVSLDV